MVKDEKSGINWNPTGCLAEEDPTAEAVRFVIVISKLFSPDLGLGE
jgi:hypothetical protein